MEIKDLKPIFIYKGARVHKSSRILVKQFGIKNDFSIKVIKKPQWLKHLYNFIQAPFVSFKLINYNVFFFEGLGSAPIIPLIKKMNKKSLIVVKGNSQEVFYMERDKKWRIAFNILNLSEHVNYMIAVSNMVKKDFEKYFDFKIITCEGFMFRDYKKLSKLKINYLDKNFIFIGSNPYFKGVDIMVDIFITMKNNNIIDNKTKFYLIGNHASFLESSGFNLDMLKEKSIVLVGQTDNIEEYLKDSLYHFHLARYEPNSVALMEGMASGHIPIISTKTGNRDFISKLDKNLIISIHDKKESILSIKKILSYSKKRVLWLSNMFKKESIIYSKENGIRRWVNTWESIIDEWRTRE